MLWVEGAEKEEDNLREKQTAYALELSRQIALRKAQREKQQIELEEFERHNQPDDNSPAKWLVSGGHWRSEELNKVALAQKRAAYNLLRAKPTDTMIQDRYKRYSLQETKAREDHETRKSSAPTISSNYTFNEPSLSPTVSSSFSRFRITDAKDRLHEKAQQLEWKRALDEQVKEKARREAQEKAERVAYEAELARDEMRYAQEEHIRAQRKLGFYHIVPQEPILGPLNMSGVNNQPASLPPPAPKIMESTYSRVPRSLNFDKADNNSDIGSNLEESKISNRPEKSEYHDLLQEIRFERKELRRERMEMKQEAEELREQRQLLRLETERLSQLIETHQSLMKNHHEQTPPTPLRSSPSIGRFHHRPPRINTILSTPTVRKKGNNQYLQQPQQSPARSHISSPRDPLEQSLNGESIFLAVEPNNERFEKPNTPIRSTYSWSPGNQSNAYDYYKDIGIASVATPDGRQSPAKRRIRQVDINGNEYYIRHSQSPHPIDRSVSPALSNPLRSSRVIQSRGFYDVDSELEAIRPSSAMLPEDYQQNPRYQRGRQQESYDEDDGNGDEGMEGSNDSHDTSSQPNIDHMMMGYQNAFPSYDSDDDSHFSDDNDLMRSQHSSLFQVQVLHSKGN